MKKINFEKILIILTIATLLSTVIIPTGVADEQQNINQVQFIISDHEIDYLEISVLIPDCTFTEKTIYDRLFTSIVLEDEGFSNVLGHAKLPTIRRMIEIPYGAEPKIRLTTEQWESYDLNDLEYSSEVIPVQKPVEKDNLDETLIDYDSKYYNSNTFYPQEKVQILEINEIRGRRFALVELAPVLYNPVTAELKIMTSCAIDIELSGVDIQKTIENIEHYYSSDYEELYSHIFSNYGFYESLGKSTKDTEGFLIIVHDDFFDEIVPLRDWKNTMGYDTHVANTSDIPGGATTTNIKSYIENAYNNWPIAPTYVLLVGDTPQIPAFTGTASGGETDTYYVTMDGDIFADMRIGRFPAATEDHVNSMVNKTIYYETGDFPSIDWIKKAAFIASSDHGALAEQTHNYVIDNHLVPNNYTCDKIYETAGGNTNDIFTALNDGRSLCIYSGHGYSQGWGCVPFDNSDVYNLNNQGMYPFVCSHACSTSTYEGTSETFSEAWVRAENKGGIAMWGSSVSTYWDEDDVIERRVFDAWWNLGLDRIGQMTDKGMYDAYMQNPGLEIEKFIESYNVMGDASVKIWSEDPFVPEHDISVETINVDSVVAHGETQTVSATVRNVGNNTETNININFTINGTVIDTDTVAQLDPKQSTQISFDWNPDYGTYHVSVESTTVPGENITDNNVVSKTVEVIAAPDVYVDPVSLEFHVNAGDSDSDSVVVGNEVWAEASLHFNASVSSGASSWLSVSPDTGMVPVDDSVGLTVSVDAALLTEGVYSGFILIECDDLDEPEVVVPVELFVVFGDDVGAVGVNYPTGQQLPGSFVVNASVENFGSMFNSFVVNCSITEGGGELLEDFEASDGGYTHGDGPGPGSIDDWEWGVPTYGPSSAHSGSNCWATNLDGDHSASADSVLDSISIDLNIYAPDPELEFYHWCDLTTYDCGNVKISTDGGLSWDIIYPDGGYPGTASSGNQGIAGEPAFTHISSGWEHVRFDLSSYAGETVMFRWHFGSTSGTNHPGWYIDDVSVSSSLSRAPGEIVYTAEESISLGAYTTGSVEFAPAWTVNDLGFYAIKIVTMLAGDEDTTNDETIDVVEIASAPEGHVSMLASGWNFVSGPFNESVLKENLVVVYDTVSYGWDDAVLGGLVSDVLFGWSGVSQSYVFGSGLVPGDGFWVYAFVDCELKAPVFSVNFDGRVCSLVGGWNVVGLPYNAPILKDSLVVDNGVAYDWSDAVTAGMVSDVLFGWESVGQSYVFVDGLYPGCAVWLYAYGGCVLESPID